VIATVRQQPHAGKAAGHGRGQRLRSSASSRDELLRPKTTVDGARDASQVVIARGAHLHGGVQCTEMPIARSRRLKVAGRPLPLPFRGTGRPRWQRSSTSEAPQGRQGSTPLTVRSGVISGYTELRPDVGGQAASPRASATRPEPDETINPAIRAGRSPTVKTGIRVIGTFLA